MTETRVWAGARCCWYWECACGARGRERDGVEADEALGRHLEEAHHV